MIKHSDNSPAMVSVTVEVSTKDDNVNHKNDNESKTVNKNAFHSGLEKLS
jgi:hypothetical protein